MSWTHKTLGKDQLTIMAVDAYNFANRVSIRPMPFGSRGGYSIALTTGILPAALAANSEIFQFRWVDGSGRIAILRRIGISAVVSTTFFAAGVPVQIDARDARAWTAQGTLGTGITFAANDQKKRTNFGTSLLAAGDVRIATTAALGAGTKTLDGNAFAAIAAPGPITASLNGMIIAPNTTLWTPNQASEYPRVYANQEGFVVRSVAVPATGTWTATVTVDWDEIDPAVANTDGWA